MFGFIKKLKPPELKQQLSVRERALTVFSKIEGLDDIKLYLLVIVLIILTTSFLAGF